MSQITLRREQSELKTGNFRTFCQKNNSTIKRYILRYPYILIKTNCSPYAILQKQSKYHYRRARAARNLGNTAFRLYAGLQPPYRLGDLHPLFPNPLPRKQNSLEDILKKTASRAEIGAGPCIFTVRGLLCTLRYSQDSFCNARIVVIALEFIRSDTHGINRHHIPGVRRMEEAHAGVSIENIKERHGKMIE